MRFFCGRYRKDVEYEQVELIGTAPDGEPITKVVKKRRALNSCEATYYFIWDTFEDAEGSQASSMINAYIMVLICMSAVVAVVETIPAIHKTQKDVWFGLETFFVINFSIEFILRFVSCPNTCSFMITPMNIVDLVAILPYYLDVILMLAAADGEPPNFSFLRILRLSRAARLVKLGKYSQGIRLVTNAMANSLDALQLFALVLSLVLVVFSSGIYYTERGKWVGDTCPSEWYTQFTPGYNLSTSATHCIKNKYYRTDTRIGHTGLIEKYPSVFQSIPQSFWWVIVTLTTVGYGDMFPYTPEGKAVGVMTMIVGLIMLALPLSIIGTNFIEERNIMVMEQQRREEEARLAELEAVEGSTINKKDVNLRRDLRELLAKADQLFDSTGYMYEQLTMCNTLVETFQNSMVDKAGNVFSPTTQAKIDRLVQGTTPLSPEQPINSAAQGTGTGAGTGGGTGSPPVEQAYATGSSSGTVNTPLSAPPAHGTEPDSSVAVEMRELSPGVGTGSPWYRINNRINVSSIYAVPYKELQKLEGICLTVMKRAIEEMQVLDPQADMPEMPAQLIEMLRNNTAQMPEKPRLWQERNMGYANVEGPPPCGEDMWSPRGEGHHHEEFTDLNFES